MTGAVLSSTIIVLLQVEVLPQSSVAVHVLVTLNSCGQVPLGVVASENVMPTFVSHASVAVAVPNAGVSGQLIGETTFGQVMMGAVLSSTKMVLLQVAVFPQSSVAVHVLVTLNSCGHIPPGVVTSAKVMSTEASQISVAVALPNTGVTGHSTGVATIGQSITGGVVSSTLIV